MAAYPMPPRTVRQALHAGLVIPAHPLALTAARKLDEVHQRALTRYYHAAGAGGVAVGVHTTQFEIRDPKYDLYRPVLEMAAQTVRECDRATGRETVRIAGIVGNTGQAQREAGCAVDLGYHLGLLSLAALKGASDRELIEHSRAVAEIIPLVGFYLQPAVGGRILSVHFWREFAQIPNVVAIKVAPFNRYQTLDVARAVVEAGRAAEIDLYTGNDDHIVLDLLSPIVFPTPAAEALAAGDAAVYFRGGLLGHWACWTKKAVEILERCKALRGIDTIPADVLRLASEVTDSNAALFDPANGYAGAIIGVHEVLRRQGLMANNYCLDPAVDLSPGQSDEIDRAYRLYPHLTDDDFVREHLDEWLR